MKNLNKIWGLIIVGVVMLVSCNTYDRSGVSDVWVPSGVTMESMYDDISNVLSEYPLSDSDMAEFERIFGDVSLTDLDIEEVMGNTDYIEYIQTTDYYKEMMKVVEKYLGGVESGLDSSSVISAINQLNLTDYVRRSHIRDVENQLYSVEDKILVSMYSSFRNNGYANFIGSNVIVSDSQGAEIMISLPIGYKSVDVVNNMIPMYEVYVTDIKKMSDEDIERILNDQPSIRYVRLEEHEMILAHQIENLEKGKFPLKVSASDCERTYNREKQEALNNYNICSASAAAIAICGMCVGAGTGNVPTVVYSLASFAITDLACKKVYNNALASAKRRYEDCMKSADQKFYVIQGLYYTKTYSILLTKR